MISEDNIKNSVEQSRYLREKFIDDPHRPYYHFIPPEDIGIPGDPNGAFFANGRYHLFYLYKCCSDSYRWGHKSSIDLNHWRCHKDAIIPDETDGGIFSGGAFVDNDGTVYLSYWALAGKGNNGGIRFMVSRDIENHYETWEKVPGYAIECTERGIRTVETPDGLKMLSCADPSNVWKNDGMYYMQTGNLLILFKTRKNPDFGDDMRGDWVDLFRSPDMKNWEFVHRFYDRDTSVMKTALNEDDMCPSFLPLPSKKEGGEPSGKYLQLFIAHNRGCQYYIGEYNRTANKFIPEVHGRMSWMDNSFFAPEALMAPDGRQIMWAWLYDEKYGDPALEMQNGWCGVLSLPRQLWLNEAGELGIAPADELRQLRYNKRDGIEGINGICCEIEMTIDMKTAAKAGAYLRCDPNMEEYTLVYYDAAAHELVFNAEKSGSFGKRITERAPFMLHDGEKLNLRIFIDKSVIEVFANDRQAISRRVYPEISSKKVMLFCEGDAEFEKITSWEIMPSNPY